MGQDLHQRHLYALFVEFVGHLYADEPSTDGDHSAAVPERFEGPINVSLVLGDGVHAGQIGTGQPRRYHGFGAGGDNQLIESELLPLGCMAGLGLLIDGDHFRDSQFYSGLGQCVIGHEILGGGIQ